MKYLGSEHKETSKDTLKYIIIYVLDRLVMVIWLVALRCVVCFVLFEMYITLPSKMKMPMLILV